MVDNDGSWKVTLGKAYAAGVSATIIAAQSSSADGMYLVLLVSYVVVVIVIVVVYFVYVTGSHTNDNDSVLTLKNVVFGDVYFCSG